MPFMQRITWSGIALHQGRVPNYPASHGCIRLPGGFAASLFGYTRQRSHVVVARDGEAPYPLTHGLLFQPANPFDVTPPAHLELRRLGGTGPAAIPPVRLASVGGIGAAVGAPPAAADPSPQPETVLSGLAAIHHMDHAVMTAHRQLYYRRRSTEPLRVLVSRQSAREKMKHMQQTLARLGFEIGEVDGVLGRQTSAAIKAFQKQVGLPPTGAPSEAFHEALYRKAGVEAPPEVHLKVRQGQKPVFAAVAGLTQPDAPMGTHLFLMVGKTASGEGSTAAWNGISLKPGGAAWEQPIMPARNARAVLDRIRIAAHDRLMLEDMLTPGSSLIVTDGGTDRETTWYTDFIVVLDH